MMMTIGILKTKMNDQVIYVVEGSDHFYRQAYIHEATMMFDPRDKTYEDYTGESYQVALINSGRTSLVKVKIVE